MCACLVHLLCRSIAQYSANKNNDQCIIYPYKRVLLGRSVRRVEKSVAECACSHAKKNKHLGHYFCVYVILIKYSKIALKKFFFIYIYVLFTFRPSERMPLLARWSVYLLRVPRMREFLVKFFLRRKYIFLSTSARTHTLQCVVLGYACSRTARPRTHDACSVNHYQ